MTTPTPTPTRRFKLAVALPLAAALIGAAAISAHAHGDRMQRMHGAAAATAMGAPMAMPLHGRGIEHMLERIDASAEQRTQIRAIVDAARADLAKQSEAGRALREQGLKLFAQPNIDAAAVEAQRQQMLQHHDQVSRRMAQAMVDVGRVLTPEQRATLVERMQQRGEMMQRHLRERRQHDGQRGS